MSLYYRAINPKYRIIEGYKKDSLKISQTTHRCNVIKHVIIMIMSFNYSSFQDHLCRRQAQHIREARCSRSKVALKQ